MKRHLTYRLSLAAVAAMSVAFFSCKDDEDPVKPVITFQQAARTVGEDAGTIDVVLQLDVDAPQDIKVRYSLSGTASEGTSSSADYQVLGSFGEVSVAKGASSGTIQLQIRNDDAVEPDETIIITLTEVVNNAATIGSTNVTTITVTSDDQGSAVSFATATRTVKESDGIVEVEVVLDKPAAQALTVDYAFNYSPYQGKAIDSLHAATNADIPDDFYDFRVQNTYGKVTIPAGSTSGKIRLKFFSDTWFEDDETVEINLTAVSTGGQLGTSTKHTITVDQEDGRVIALLWDPAYDDVDMDLFLWWGADENSFEEDPLAFSINPAFTPQQELVFIPKVLADAITEATFGVSYTYYEGTPDPMTFEVQFVDFTNGTLEVVADRDIYTADYTAANINPWFESGDAPQVVQTFKVVDGEYVDLSDITVPASGSRKATQSLPAGLKKTKTGFSTRSKLLKR